MDFFKVFQGIIVGALFSGVLTAICATYISLTSNMVYDFGFTAKDFWWLTMLLAGLFGLIAGGILGGIISVLNLSLISAGICGFLITAIPAVLFRIVPVVKEFDEDVRWFVVSFIIITTFNAIFVSYIQTNK